MKLNLRTYQTDAIQSIYDWFGAGEATNPDNAH